MLFSLGSLFALVEGVDKLRNPEHIDSPIVAYVVLGVAIVLEALSLRTARREALPMREGRSWWRFIHTTKNAEIPVVLLEDTGALVGLFIALIGHHHRRDHRRPALGRGRQPRDRPAARRDRGDPRHRDEEPADR